MRLRLCFGLLAALLISGAIARAQETPYTNGVLTNPAANAILAEAPASDVDHPQMRHAFVICSTVAAIVFLEKRNATNTGNVWSQAYTVAANDCREPAARLMVFAPGEFIRLRLNTGVTGSMQATIFQE